MKILENLFAEAIHVPAASGVFSGMKANADANIVRDNQTKLSEALTQLSSSGEAVLEYKDENNKPQQVKMLTSEGVFRKL